MFLVPRLHDTELSGGRPRRKPVIEGLHLPVWSVTFTQELRHPGACGCPLTAAPEQGALGGRG